MNKNVIIRGIGAVVLLLSVGGCGIVYVMDPNNPNIRRMCDYSSECESIPFDSNLDAKSLTYKTYQTKINYRWYDSDKDGNLTSKGQAALTLYNDQANDGDKGDM